jgi:hypothetical protein
VGTTKGVGYSLSEDKEYYTCTGKSRSLEASEIIIANSIKNIPVTNI